MRTHVVRTTLAALFMSAAVLPAAAQDGGSFIIEAQAGYAGFLDDATIDHGFVGGAFKTRLTRTLWIGPEIVWMRGPDRDRDLFLTGTLTWDLAPPEARRHGSSARPGPRFVPFFVAGGGVMRHEDRFFNETFASWEGAVTGGGGARIRVGRRWYVAPEFRVGWEPHYRIGVSIGMDASKE